MLARLLVVRHEGVRQLPEPVPFTRLLVGIGGAPGHSGTARCTVNSQYESEDGTLLQVQGQDIENHEFPATEVKTCPTHKSSAAS